MKHRALLVLTGLALAAASLQAQRAPRKPSAPPVAAAAKPAAARPAGSSLVTRVDNTGFIQLEADSFNALDMKHKALAYWLVQASIAIDPIIYDQLSAYGIREKRLIEEIMARPAGTPAPELARIRSFALLFWANRGNHNENTAQKFLPGFTPAELEAAALRTFRAGGFRHVYADLPPLMTEAEVKRELADLQAPLFDPAFEPMATAKTPPPGQDILQASSNTFYRLSLIHI